MRIKLYFLFRLKIINSKELVLDFRFGFKVRLDRLNLIKKQKSKAIQQSVIQNLNSEIVNITE